MVVTVIAIFPTGRLSSASSISGHGGIFDFTYCSTRNRASYSALQAFSRRVFGR